MEGRMLSRLAVISLTGWLFSAQGIGYAQHIDYRAGKMIVNVVHNPKLTDKGSFSVLSLDLVPFLIIKIKNIIFIYVKCW